MVNGKEYDFSETFKELSRIHDPSIVFNDWMSYCIDQFLINPDTKYFPFNNYKEEEYKSFWGLFECWVHGMDEALETHKWYDLIGVYYEENVKSRGKASDMGQFFTPHDVCELMTELNTHKDDRVGTVYDPAGGSGRFCLAYHVRHPEALCFSHDLDEFACKMAVLNFLIHGVKGSVCRYNSLSGEFYAGWKVNEAPFTIMEVTKMSESLIFIGEDTPCLNIHKKESTDINESKEEVKIDKRGNSDVVVVGQSSLEDYL